MINIRRLIPLAAGSAFLVLGCSQEGSLARKYCKEWKSCNEETFDDDFNSVAECARVYRKQAEAQAAANKLQGPERSKECFEAGRAYEECQGEELSCDAFPDPSSESDQSDLAYWSCETSRKCFDEYKDYLAECVEDIDSDYLDDLEAPECDRENIDYYYDPYDYSSYNDYSY